MKTIGLPDNQKTFRDARDEDGDTRTIFEAERPVTFDYGAGAEQASGNLFKQNLLLLIRKFVSYKRSFINNRSLVTLKPSLA